MKRRISFALSLLIALSFAASCKKPKADKAVLQQTIQTPVMKLAEPPQQAQPANITEDQQQLAALQSAAPAQTVQAQAVPQTPSIAASQTLVKSAVNIEIIIDASGSMNSPSGTTTKIEAVKKALKEIFATPLPVEASNRKVAIRTFGGRSPADKDDCTDTSLDLAMGKYDQMSFDAALDKIKAQGTSPIAYSLEEAYKDFPESSGDIDNMIVLIADGGDSCNGDILAAVDRLHKGPGKVIFDVIGYDIDQTTMETLKKAAQTGSGQFFLARSATEVATALDQAISANLPYNLRVKVLSGASPLPSIITVYRANTQSVVDRSDSPGFKFFKLAPGTYDIQVEYRDSIEVNKPSKIIKGVEVTASSKAEQAVQFDLGTLNLLARDQNGNDTTANIFIRRSGEESVVGQLIAVQSPQTLHLTPGTYDIDAETAAEGSATLTAQLKGVEIKSGETTEKLLRFQTGRLSLKVQNVAKELIAATYRVTKAGLTDVVAEGEATVDGALIDLPPGNYDVHIIWSDTKLNGKAETKLENVTINGGETLEQLATIVTGTVRLFGKGSDGKPTATLYSIKHKGSNEEIATATSDNEPIELLLAPGIYTITAVDSTSKVVPPPSFEWSDVNVKEGETVVMEVIFKLGTIKLLGKNAKEQLIPTTFTVYRSGTDQPLVTETSEKDWVVFNLTPGMYDVKAEDASAQSDPKPSIWFNDILVKEGSSVSNEAIFTSGKLKLICRGKNNIILSCEFNVFTYGSDTALFSGETEDEWKEFDIPPGKYYMEAGWHDPVGEVFLKKWINISIGENQVVEQVLRF